VLEDQTTNVKDAAFTQIRRGSDYDGYSIRTARWRYTLWDNGRRGEQLFDMVTDPREAKNLAADSKHASLVEDLKRRVRAYAQAAP
jgi:iduronate 2-sulfatase